MAVESKNEIAHKIAEQERLLKQAMDQENPDQMTVAKTELEIRRLKNLLDEGVKPAREVEIPEQVNQNPEILQGVDKQLTAEELTKQDGKDNADPKKVEVIASKETATGKVEDAKK